jgi:hypothetical protein
VKRALAAVVMLVACGHAAPRAADPPAEQVLPDAGVELRLRQEAAAALGCETAATAVARESWSGKSGTYVVRGCGFETRYLVACDAPDRCGFTPSE